jgi:hypothetical protein
VTGIGDVVVGGRVGHRQWGRRMPWEGHQWLCQQWRVRTCWERHRWWHRWWSGRTLRESFADICYSSSRTQQDPQAAYRLFGERLASLRPFDNRTRM